MWVIGCPWQKSKQGRSRGQERASNRKAAGSNDTLWGKGKERCGNLSRGGAIYRLRKRGLARPIRKGQQTEKEADEGCPFRKDRH